MKMWSNSSYFNTLNKSDQLDYKKKLTLENKETLPDPYSIDKPYWSTDLTKIPDISWGDVYNYLINSTSEYTHEKLKAFKSLEAYNFFVCGHVNDIYYYEVSKDCEFCFLKSKVLPSQRQGQNQKLYSVWVVLHKKIGYILTGNCKCMAGLGSVCSHVAALLFKIEACIRTEVHKTAVTSKLCQWNQIKRKAEASSLQNISFNRPKLNDLPIERTLSNSNSKNYTVNAEQSIINLGVDKVIELQKIMPKAAYFNYVNVLELSYDTEGTLTSDENDENPCPEPLTSLFDYEAINLDSATLKDICNLKYEEYKSTYTSKSFNFLSENTKLQSLSSAWNIHRAGRITASNFYEVMHFKYKNSSNSLLNKLMCYTKAPNTPSLTYGREMECKAREHYQTIMKEKHNDFQVTATGLHILYNKPYLGASPDSIVSCSCHSDGLLEIKCPFNYRNGLVNWEMDNNFPIDSSVTMKKNHKYYAQVQGQLYVLNKEYCDFFVWAPNHYLLIRVTKDLEFIDEMMSLLWKYFIECLLPEVVTRKNDVCLDNKQKYYCTCKRPCFEPMIACDKPGCKVEWFHYSCVKITRAPVGPWICNSCSK
ncbi:uncharacterized protein LOC124816975 [Hydra vulgaris]|uniref:uncharacterized protein LOC124816975 n=1 Tax=Hydra vulgaris TaxID=6087 RepID=UPI0032EA4208